jgi:DNA-directed RNA polymerase specialized sigma24 family protein
MVERQEEARLLGALRSLPLDQQILLELFYWENLGGSELAELFDLAEGTVRSRLRRARELLVLAYDRLDRSSVSAPTTDTNIDGWARRIREQLVEQQAP